MSASKRKREATIRGDPVVGSLTNKTWSRILNMVLFPLSQSPEYLPEFGF